MIYILTTGPFPYGMASVARLKCYMRAFTGAQLHSEIDVFERTPEFGKDRRNFDVRVTNDGFYYWYAGGCLYGAGNRILRKFEQLNLSFIRDEIDGYVKFLDKTFGKENMSECKEYLARLKKAM